MRVETLLEVLWAATLTSRVVSKFDSRGGIFLVAPPGQLKTSFLKIFDEQPGVLGFSDMTTNNLVSARDMISSRKVHTVTFYDFQKIYERRADTASNIVGNIRALTDEGFKSASFEQGGESTRVIQAKARALVLAATTPSFYRQNLGEWTSNGFARRFLFCVYTMRDPDIMVDAIMNERPIELRNMEVALPANLAIDMAPTPTQAEAAMLRRMLRNQAGEEVPLVLLRKIHAVLRWKCQRLGLKDSSMETLEEFSQCLNSEGAQLVVNANPFTPAQGRDLMKRARKATARKSSKKGR